MADFTIIPTIRNGRVTDFAVQPAGAAREGRFDAGQGDDHRRPFAPAFLCLHSSTDTLKGQRNRG